MPVIKGPRFLTKKASSSIGRTAAFEFAKRGAKSAVTARRLKTLRKVSDEIKDAFPEVQAPLSTQYYVLDRKETFKLK
jgi:NADP-dependent 3-hydroxy acid dehydrogenase YdfG